MEKNVKYLVKVNNEFVASLNTLKEARDYVRDMNSICKENELPNEVYIVREVVERKVVDTYKAKTTKVLMCDSLGLE